MTEMATINPADIPYKEHKRHEIVVSVDLAKSRDYTAYTISEAKPKVVENLEGRSVTVMLLNVLNIRRLPHGVDYPVVAQHIHDVYHDPRLLLQAPRNHRPIYPELLIDSGGVGEPVCDTIERQMGIKPIRYNLVRGTARTTRHGRYKWSVPRPYMFQMLDGAFASNRIAIDPRLTLAKELVEELKNLKLETDEETGAVRVTHREGTHDDLAICLASTNWWVNEPQKKRSVLTVVG